MSTVIAFRKSSVSVTTFDSLTDAEQFAEKEKKVNAIFVITKVDAPSLMVLSSEQLLALYNAANPDNIVSKPFGSKRSMTERVAPLISKLATPGAAPTTSTTKDTTMAATRKRSTKKAPEATTTTEATTKKSAKAAKEPKATKESAKKAPEATGAKRGRAPSYAGMKLYKLERGSERMQPGSRRFASFQVVTNGMKYETALEKGAHPFDLTIMIREARLEARNS